MSQRYTDLTPATAGAAQKAAVRDLTLYPDTDAGKASLLAAANNGTLPLVDSVPVGARVGNPLSPLTESRSDSLGVALTKTPGVTLKGFTIRLAPRRTGNYYALAPQQAQATVLAKRIADVTLHPSRTSTYSGPFFTDAADMAEILKKGFTHIAESTPNYASILPVGKISPEYGSVWFDRAQVEAANLQANSPGDARIPWLLDFDINSQKFPDFAPAAELIGRSVFSVVPQCEWIAINIENCQANNRAGCEAGVGNRDGQYFNVLYNMYRGFILAAQEAGRPAPKPLMIDQGNLCFNVLYFRDGISNGLPEYYDPVVTGNPIICIGGQPGAVLNVNHPLAGLIKQYGGALGIVSYQRFTWDSESFFQKNPDGSYKLGSDGNPLWRTDDRWTTIAGQRVPISGALGNNSDPNTRTNDALWMNTFYFMRQALLCRNFELRAGGGYLTSNQPQAGWSNLQLIARHRADTETGGNYNFSGATQSDFNSRTRNAQDVEDDVISGYIFAQVNRTWMEGQPSYAMGQVPPVVRNGGLDGSINTGKGYWETYMKAMHRASELNFLHDTTWNLIQPRCFIRRQETGSSPDPLEHYARKLSLVGGSVPSYNGKSYVWMKWRYPCQEETDSRDVIMWAVDTDGVTPITPGYRLTCQGREVGLDYWQVSDAAGNIPASRWRFQIASDLLGNKQTETGDYRDARITNHPVPPAVLEAFSVTTPVTPTPGGGALSFGTLNYTASTKKLLIPVNGAIGPITYIIVGVGVFTSQPSDGFLITENAVGTTLAIRVHTDTQAEVTTTVAAVADGGSTPTVSVAQRLKFSMQNNFDPNIMAGNVGKYDQLGLASITHEDARTENGTFFPAVILPPYFPDFIGAGGNAIGIYTQRWHYQLTRSAWGRTVQLTNQIGHLRSHNIPYTFRGCVGVDWYSDSDNKFSDLMGKADAMKRSDGTTVAANNNSACPRLPLLKAYKASVAAGTPDTGNPWHWVRQYIVYMTNLVKTDLQSGLCEAIGFTLGGRWEDTYPYDGDGNSIFWIADYDPATIADFQATKNTSYTPGFDAGNRSRNTFSSAGGKLWYLYCEDNYIILKDWITSVIHEAVPAAPGVGDFGQYGGSGGDAAAARMLNFTRIAQSCARIKVNPDISQSAGYVSDVVRTTGKVMEMETDNGPWYQLSNSDMSDKLNAYFQAGFKDVQFGQAGDPALWSRILGYATYFTSHHALGNVPTITPVGNGGTYPLSTLLSGNQDNTNLWTLAGGNATDRITFTLVDDLR